MSLFPSAVSPTWDPWWQMYKGSQVSNTSAGTYTTEVSNFKVSADLALQSPITLSLKEKKSWKKP